MAIFFTLISKLACLPCIASIACIAKISRPPHKKMLEE